MAQAVEISIDAWGSRPVPPDTAERALAALESGQVLFFPHLQFDAGGLVGLFADGEASDPHKNISYDPARDRLGGADGCPAPIETKAALERYSRAAQALVTALLPRYGACMRVGRTSFRPTEIEGRVISWRKDDTRLHVDSFPSSPVRGHRILRVFSNVNDRGEPRCWRTGEPYEAIAKRFLGDIRGPLPGSGALLEWLRITKSRRSAYDHYMLQLHDAMKRDAQYQRESQQDAIDFPAGSSWMVFTDQVSHAAMKGRGAFEQTFYVPVSAMRAPEASPLRTLERLLGHTLAGAE